jgi:hypothetical protein
VWDRAVFEDREPHGWWSSLRVLSEQLLLARDGTQDFSSHPLHCHNCLKRHTATGPTLSYQSAIPPVLVCPGRAEVIALPPACIRPQDGHDKPDGERVAGQRWMDQHATYLAPSGVTWLGTALDRTPPVYIGPRKRR